MNIGVAQTKAAWTLPPVSKITPGSWCIFANYCCLHSFFWKKSQNDIISPTFVLQVICFTTSIKINVLVELTKYEFPCRNNNPEENSLVINQWFGVVVVETSDKFSKIYVSFPISVNSVYLKFNNCSNLYFHFQKTKLGI